MSDPTSKDTRFWIVATWSLAGFFFLQIVFMGLAALVLNSDTDEKIFESFLTASILIVIIATALRWKARGAVRGIALAATATAAIWVPSSAAIGLLYLTAR